MDLLQNYITPADGERTVRTYCCTYYKSSGFETNGYLGITNKRVIFQALSTTGKEKNIIQSEVPISDVSGISSYKGFYSNPSYILRAILITIIAIGLSMSLFGAMRYSMDDFTALGWIFGIGAIVGTYFLSFTSIWRAPVAGVAVAAFFNLGRGTFYSSGNGFATFLAIAASVYTLFCIEKYSRRPTFSLAINSKGGSSTPIVISAAKGLNAALGKGLNAEPAQDADVLLNEIGAVIMDIQMMGDYGIAKWSK